LLTELVLIAPDLAVRFPELAPLSSADPAAQQPRAFEGFALFCEALTAHEPLLLFIDDVHWADAGTLQLIHYLARRIRHLPLLLVLTYREIELDENPLLGRLLQDLNRERLASRLKLGRLTSDQTRQLLQAMFSEEISPEFLDGIYRESEGNPFFVEEICKALVDSGRIRFEDGRWQRPGVEDLEIPQSVRGAVLSRVDKLSEPAREAMLMAAILGREFEFETLRRATELPEETLIGALESAERAQLISETRRNGDVAFSFVHALIPASLTESVSVLRRKMLHRRAAQAIEAGHPDAWEILAYHWIEAGEDDLARSRSLRAADRDYASLAGGGRSPLPGGFGRWPCRRPTRSGGCPWPSWHLSWFPVRRVSAMPIARRAISTGNRARPCGPARWSGGWVVSTTRPATARSRCNIIRRPLRSSKAARRPLSWRWRFRRCRRC
jgi:hypothetical protein